MLGKIMHLWGFKGLGIAFAKRRPSQSVPKGRSIVQALTCQFAGAIVLWANCAIAQITPDATLPNNSNVLLEGNTRIISGGTQAGSNLFHSFSEFSVPTNSTASFNNASDVQNIISRVTGNSISNINGLIRANGTANLFLMNPNGIIFGENARVNVGGSFFATSAWGMKFADGLEFSANPQQTPLLTINVPVGLQFGSNAGSVSIRGSSLQVNPGRSLALIGGNVSIDGGKLVAPSGRVELGGVVGENTVELFPIGDFFGLNFPQGVPQADMSLTNRAEVNVLSSSGGSISLNAANLNISGESQLLTGISGVGSPNTQAGDIKINATGIVAIADGSKIFNEVAQNAVGNSGNINITAGSLSLSNNSFVIGSTKGEGNAGNITIDTGSLSVAEGSLLAASANGQGNAGNITINARDRVSFGKQSQAYTNVTLKGNGGDINITTGSLFVSDGSFLASSTEGEGNAGNITINARDTVSFSQGSRAYTDVTNKGNGGNINITTGSLFVSDNDSFLASSTEGEGNAGNITINARDTISFDGGSAYTDVGETGIGQAGNLNITSESLSLKNRAQLLASTKNEGNAGNITIDTGSLSVADNSFLAASANGQQGNAGNITINARGTISFSKGSRAYTDVTLKGNGGDINITTGSLFVSDNDSFLASSTKGEGNAGNITINARDTISFDGGSAYTDVGETGIGQAGNLNITSESLSLRNRAQLLASTKNEGNAGNITIDTGSLSVADNSFLAASANGQQGNAGNITINARGTISFSKGSRAYTDVTLKGNGGDINITTGSLFVSDNDSFLASSTKGEGNAGNITINARDRVLFDRGSAYTDVGETGIGRAGNLNITSESLSLTNGAQLLASTKKEGNAGNIIINTGSLSVVEGSFLAASANGQQGNAGNITINARDRVSFDRAGQVYTNVTGTGNGGKISIITGLLTVTNGSQLSASTLGVGNAGNLTFNTGSFLVTNNSLLSASSSGVGNAGDIIINTGSLSVTNESFLASSANGQGNAGNITIDARDTVSFENGAQVYTDVNLLPFSSTIAVKGDGGDIKISSGSLLLTNGAQLISNTQGEGDAGDITINTGSLSVTNESFLASSANGQRGNAGDITINAGERVFFDKGSAFSNVGVCSLIAVGCTPSNNTIKGNGGDITVKAASLELINGSFLATGVGDDQLPGNKVEGNGGNISISLKDDLLLARSFITTRLFTNGKGKAGDIDIRAGSVSSYQSLISASTQGQGNAGGVSVQTTGTVSLVDSDISTAVQKGAIGDAQGINITARSLLLTDGAQLNAVTSGEGKAGNILIKTTDISVSGTNTTVAPTNLFQNNIPPRFNSPPKFVDGVESGIFTSTNSSGVGGDITVNTNTFSIFNGSLVDARTTASGRGGAIRVNTNTFEALSGGQLSAITSGSGTAGSITLNATGSVTIRDSDPTYLTRLAQFASDPIDIYGKLKVGNQGSASGLTVSSAESGSAGDLTVQANSIRLDNGAKISADTTGGGGNIFLNSPLLLLRRGSSITTNASGNDITGGNIIIDARNGFIIAVPSENSDIRADSEDFRGGNIKINNAAGIFGIQPRQEPSPQTSDITATGATADLRGTLQINNPDIDPQKGLVPLAIDVVDVASLVEDNICARTTNSSFTYTGRGGLPPSPNNTLNSDAVWEDWRLTALPRETQEQRTRGNLDSPLGIRGLGGENHSSRPTQIVEAQGWIINQNGEVTLTAYASTTTPYKVGSSSFGCQPPIAK